MFTQEIGVRLLIVLIGIAISTSVFAVDYEPGQIWKYKTRIFESESTLMILKVETYDDIGEVIHIRVNGINMINPKLGNKINGLPHLPFKKLAIDSSVISLVKTVSDIPNFKDGYNTWKKAYIAGKAGAFSTKVNVTLTAMLGADWVVQE